MTRVDVPVGIRFDDLDADGHVNRAAMLAALEEARIPAFRVQATSRYAVSTMSQPE